MVEVYLVFSYLIVPSVCAALLSGSVRTRLIIGWVVALVAGVSGLLLSVDVVALDLPTGPTIVCCCGVLLVRHRDRGADPEQGLRLTVAESSAADLKSLEQCRVARFAA